MIIESQKDGEKSKYAYTQIYVYTLFAIATSFFHIDFEHFEAENFKRAITI